MLLNSPNRPSKVCKFIFPNATPSRLLIKIDNNLTRRLSENAFVILFVIPAKAGIQLFQALIDSRLRGNDSLSYSRTAS